MIEIAETLAGMIMDLEGLELVQNVIRSKLY